jgi:hypothetical protein
MPVENKWKGKREKEEEKICALERERETNPI